MMWTIYILLLLIISAIVQSEPYSILANIVPIIPSESSSFQVFCFTDITNDVSFHRDQKCEDNCGYYEMQNTCCKMFNVVKETSIQCFESSTTNSSTIQLVATVILPQKNVNVISDQTQSVLTCLGDTQENAKNVSHQKNSRFYIKYAYVYDGVFKDYGMFTTLKTVSLPANEATVSCNRSLYMFRKNNYNNEQLKTAVILVVFVMSFLCLYLFWVMIKWLFNNIEPLRKWLRTIMGQEYREVGGTSDAMLEGLRIEVSNLTKAVGQHYMLNPDTVGNIQDTSMDPNSTGEEMRNSIKDYASLLSEDYCTFSFDKVVGLEEKYTLEHFEFVEIVLTWIMRNNRSQDIVKSLWDNIRQPELCYWYLYRARDIIMSSGKVSVPKIERLHDDQYKYLSGKMKLDTSSQLTPLEINKICKKCKGQYNIKVNFVDKTPCYEVKDTATHCLVKDAIVVTVNRGELFDSGDKSEYKYFSLHTYNYTSILEKIIQCWSSNTEIYLVFMYKCNKE